MIDFTKKEHYGYEDMVNIIHLLRAPGGCPWDREQTHQSIRRNFLEETYEALEAIDEDDPVHLCEELGDVLTQVVFHGDMEAEAGRFTLEDIYDGVCRKMIGRHPHVFGDTQVSGSSQVLDNWEVLKRKEKGQETFSDTLRAVAKNLPASWRAEKLQKKAGKAGFRWEGPLEALDKLREEAGELEAALTRDENPVEELGDLLFAAVGVSFAMGADPEETLHSACEKFIHRFSQMETLAAEEGKTLDQLPRERLLDLWVKAKDEGDKSDFQEERITT